MARYVHTGTVRDRQRSGRPQATTTRTDRFIMLTHLSQRFLPATDVMDYLPKRNRLQKNNNSHPCASPLLNN